MFDVLARLSEYRGRPPVRRDYDWVLGGMLLALIALCFMLAYGCHSTPCVPDVQIQEVYKPQPCVVTVKIPPPPNYEAYPPYDDADPKEWLLEFERVTRTNRALREDYINRLRELIAAHNRLEPQCK